MMGGARKTARADRVIGLVFASAGLGLALHARTMPTPDLMGDVGPGFFPALIGWSMAGLGLALSVTARGPGPAPIERGRVPITLAFAAVAVAYAVAFEAFGFSWSSWGALVAGAALLGRRDPARLALTALAAAAFVALLGVALKRGLGIPLTGVWF